MDTNIIRQRILELAFRGELLGEHKSGEALPVLDDEVPFAIPSTWAWRKLGDIGMWQCGITPSRSHPEYYGGNIPWLKTGDLCDGYVYESAEHLTAKALQETSSKLMPADSVVMAMYGSTLGKLGILTFPAATNQACCTCSHLKGVSAQYLFYYLLSRRAYFLNRAGGEQQINISKEIIITTFIPVPPRWEQTRLVQRIKLYLNLLDSIDEQKRELLQTVNNFAWEVLNVGLRGYLLPAKREPMPVAPPPVPHSDATQFSEEKKRWSLPPLVGLDAHEGDFLRYLWRLLQKE